MPLALTCFVAAFAGAFSGVVAARVVGAWTVRRTFERLRAAATTSHAAVPASIGADAVGLGRVHCMAYNQQGMGRLSGMVRYYCDRGEGHPGDHHNANVGEWTRAPSIPVGDDVEGDCG